MTQPVLVGEPVDLSHAEYVEITITRDRVYVHTDRGLMFRAHRVGRIMVRDNRAFFQLSGETDSNSRRPPGR